MVPVGYTELPPTETPNSELIIRAVSSVGQLTKTRDTLVMTA